MLLHRPVLALAAVVALAASLSSQVATIDTSTIGPPVGAVAPPFSGRDQFGQERSLSSILGPNGAMLVFFRSADW